MIPNSISISKFSFSLILGNIKPLLRATFLISTKSIFYKHVLIFLVENFFASVKLF